MARSRKYPVYTEGYGKVARQKSKRAAAKAVRRRSKELALRGGEEADTPKELSQFKKEYNSWDICDFKIRDRGRRYHRK